MEINLRRPQPTCCQAHTRRTTAARSMTRSGQMSVPIVQERRTPAQRPFRALQDGVVGAIRHQPLASGAGHRAVTSAATKNVCGVSGQSPAEIARSPGPETRSPTGSHHNDVSTEASTSYTNRGASTAAGPRTGEPSRSNSGASPAGPTNVASARPARHRARAHPARARRRTHGPATPAAPNSASVCAEST